MTDDGVVLGPLPVANVRTLLCDADGTLFDSELPAFEASATVTNRLLATWGVRRSFTPAELRRDAVGRNFRSTVLALAAEAGVRIEPDELERWVVTEREAVVAHLAAVLRPSPDVTDVLTELARTMGLAIVTSSARTRLDACLRVTDLEQLFPSDVRFSAEDSLPRPTTKPDPAVYRFAGEQLAVTPDAALAVEDSVAGARSAVAAGFVTVGILHFVPLAERDALVEQLGAVGVAAIVRSWSDLGRLLAPAGAGRPSAR